MSSTEIQRNLIDPNLDKILNDAFELDKRIKDKTDKLAKTEADISNSRKAIENETQTRNNLSKDVNDLVMI